VALGSREELEPAAVNPGAKVGYVRGTDDGEKRSPNAGFSKETSVRNESFGLCFFIPSFGP
jgi:hypothetical protein